MSHLHFAQVGAMGHVGQFRSVDGVSYPRESRVIARTARGLEIAKILVSAELGTDEGQAHGTILRGMTAEDYLLAARLEKDKDRAFAACTRRIADRGCSATLIDVEQLFDGCSLFFYFLGEITPAIEAITGELAEIYEKKVKIREFADALTHGCGPDCGTEDAAGGCENCISCSISAACGTRA